MNDRLHGGLVPGLIFALLVTAGGIACASAEGGAAAAPKPMQAKRSYPKAPDVTFTAMDGKAVPLSSLKGSVVLVNFWGVRCANCIEEMPFLERLHHKYGSKGMVIWGVNTDGLDAETLQKFLPNLPKMSYTISLDMEFLLSEGFEMNAAPLTILVAKDGTVRYKHEGYEPAVEQEYIDLIEKLLAE